MEQKQKSRKKYVNISIAVLLILFIAFMIIRHDRVIGSTHGLRPSIHDRGAGYWRMFIGQVNDGAITRTRHFSARDLEHFIAFGYGETGTQVFLTITQGENTKTVDISSYPGSIDMSGFSPGRTSLKLRFLDAGSASATVAWGRETERFARFFVEY